MIRVEGLTNGADGSVAVDMASADDDDAYRCETGAAKPATDETVAAREIRIEIFILLFDCSALPSAFDEQLIAARCSMSLRRPRGKDDGESIIHGGWGETSSVIYRHRERGRGTEAHCEL